MKYVWMPTVFCLLVMGCKKNVAKYDKDYIGNWDEEGEAISIADGCGPAAFGITSTGYGYFSATSGDMKCTDHHKGKVKVNDKWLQIGPFHKMRLDVPPTRIDSHLFGKYSMNPFYSTMKMVLDGRTFYKRP